MMFQGWTKTPSSDGVDFHRQPGKRKPSSEQIPDPNGSLENRTGYKFIWANPPANFFPPNHGQLPHGLLTLRSFPYSALLITFFHA